ALSGTLSKSGTAPLLERVLRWQACRRLRLRLRLGLRLRLDRWLRRGRRGACGPSLHLRNLLQPLLQRLLIGFLIIWVARPGIVAPARLGLRLEGFPDDR